MIIDFPVDKNITDILYHTLIWFMILKKNVIKFPVISRIRQKDSEYYIKNSVFVPSFSQGRKLQGIMNRRGVRHDETCRCGA